MNRPTIRMPKRYMIRPHSRTYGGRFKIRYEAVLPRIREFPDINRLLVGESFYMRKDEHTDKATFRRVREAVLRCNESRAAYFICQWIEYRQVLEIARLA